MATCPKCMGPLTEGHRCPHGIVRRVTDAVSTVGVGAVAGALFSFLMADSPAPALILAAAALGAVLSSAIRQVVGRK